MASNSSKLFVKSSKGSSAIRIVNPNTQDEVSRPQSRKDSVNRKCKNMILYGSCRLQGKGCTYDHDTAEDSEIPSTPSIDQSLSNMTLNDPASPTPSQATVNVNAPVFVPKTSPVISYAQPAVTEPQTAAAAAAFALSTSDYGDYEYQYQDQPEHDGYDMVNPEMYHHYDQQPLESFYPEFLGPFVREPLNYHLYTNTIPRKYLATPQDSHFALNSNDLRELLHQRSETTRSGIVDPSLPEEIQGYHTLVPLQAVAADGTEEKRKYGMWHSTVYKAVHSLDGITYALRRVTNFRLPNQSAFASIDTWNSIKHPGIVSVIAAFTSQAFGDSSLFVVYAYHPGARTLADTHIKANNTTSTNGSSTPSAPSTPGRVTLTSPSKNAGRGNFATKAGNGNNQNLIPETTLWSYMIQIASAIKAVHEVGLPVRQIEVSKVLVTGRNRIRIGACGLVDILLYETPQDLGSLQQEDFVMLGRLIVILCCNNHNAASPMGFQKNVDWIGRTYGPEVKDLIMWLVKAPHKHIHQLFDLIGTRRIMADAEASLQASDALEYELMGELENARLVRLLCKINFITERQGFAQDATWSESGDRYIIKLFRDYVFHQQDETMNPILDLSHVVTALNKLDAGTEEKMMLISRDEQSCLVVSYKDVKRCIETSFSELAAGSHATTNYH